MLEKLNEIAKITGVNMLMPVNFVNTKLVLMGVRFTAAYLNY